MRAVNIGSLLVVFGSISVGFVREARAAEWANGMFAEKRHDFGPVPRGAKVRYPFVLNNRLAEAVAIVDVHASCGCTRGQASAPGVGAGRSAVIEAEMDTRNFVGKKATTLTVTIRTESGREAEVQLHVSSNILSDIVLNPGTLDFGNMAKGQTATLAMTIDRIGNPDWHITRMLANSQALDGTLVETARDSRKVSYKLTLTVLPTAPAGPLRDEVILKTDDPESPAFPVQVVGAVRGDLTATPRVLGLHKPTPTAAAQGRYLLRATKPFTVRSIDGLGEGFSVTADDTNARTVHVLTVNYRPAPTGPLGDVRHAFRVHTDLAGEPALELIATARVER